MPWKDFREFLAEIDRRGEVKVVEGADCDLEIGTLTELMSERHGPMLLFDCINGYPAGYRIAAKPYTTLTRNAVALGLPEDLPLFELFKLWREKLRAFQPIKPREVPTSAVMENVLEGDAVDLGKFPVPRWHELDGGPYFGTGCAVITRAPDEDWVNVGTYRSMLHPDGRSTGIDIAPFHHGNLHMQRWWAQGQNCPIAVAITPEPYLFCASTNAWAKNEYEYAGYIKGEPLEVITGPRTGLPLPASAELIIEGEVAPLEVEARPEGPFGEFTGYYGAGERSRPVIRIQAIYHRTDPILHGEPPLKPPCDHIWLCPPPGSCFLIWDGLEKAGIPGIKGVCPLNTGADLITVVMIRQQYAGHAAQVARAASGMFRNICRVLVVVDDDIDPSNPEEVLWAIATRSDPETTMEIQRNCPSIALDPMMPPEQKRRGQLTNSRLVIVACRPWEWRNEFPPVNKASEELRERTYAKWRWLLDGAPAKDAAGQPAVLLPLPAMAGRPAVR